MGDESGGLSANRAAGQEDEGNTVPFPEKVFSFGIGLICVWFWFPCNTNVYSEIVDIRILFVFCGNMLCD